MGVRGFTTFVSNNAPKFYETFKLKNSRIVIDGNGVAIYLYEYTKSNDCFGGDYDEYSKTVHEFFAILKKCNVTPIILFDGGHEDRKLERLSSRMKNRIDSIKRLMSGYRAFVFPLFVNQLFQEIALELGIKCIRNDYEADSEIACLAGNLNCPVLGYDSDFYFFDVLYIPLTEFEREVMNTYNRELSKYESYIPCKVYKIDKFLKNFIGLDRTHLPLLPVLIGNDYVEENILSVFHYHVQLVRSEVVNERQRLILSTIQWLRHKTFESAISEILGWFESQKRNFICNLLNDAMRGYLQVNSTLTVYLDTLDQSSLCFKREYDILAVEQMNSASENNQSKFSSDAESNQDVSQLMNQLDLQFVTKHEWPFKIDANPENLCFIDKYRKCLLSDHFVDIKIRNTYFCVTQVEDYSGHHSHHIALNILRCIHKILTQPSIKNLTCIARGKGDTLSEQVQPIYSKHVPSFEEIQVMNLDQCKNLCFDILHIDKRFQSFLNLFSSDWHLFFISLYYWKSNSQKNVDTSSIYSLIFCSLILNVIDLKIGFCRSMKELSKPNIHIGDSEKKERFMGSEKSVMSAIENITYGDSQLFLETVLNYFYLKQNMYSNSRLYDVAIISLFSEFQSCYFHIKFLNSIFKFPFKTASVSKFFNGTFLYNSTLDFKKQTNLKLYISSILRNCPTILKAFEMVTRSLDKIFDEKPSGYVNKTRTQAKKNEVIEQME